MAITPEEVTETLNMVFQQNLDLRTITMGISLFGCADESMSRIWSASTAYPLQTNAFR